MKRYRKDKKVTILELRIETDEDGFGKRKFDPIKGLENIWAYYRHLSGKEFFEAATMNSKVEAIFIVNWKEKLVTTNPITMRVLYNNEQYDITQIDDFEGRKTDIKIYAHKIN